MFFKCETPAIRGFPAGKPGNRPHGTFFFRPRALPRQLSVRSPVFSARKSVRFLDFRRVKRYIMRQTPDRHSYNTG